MGDRCGKCRALAGIPREGHRDGRRARQEPAPDRRLVARRGGVRGLPRACHVRARRDDQALTGPPDARPCRQAFTHGLPAALALTAIRARCSAMLGCDAATRGGGIGSALPAAYRRLTAAMRRTFEARRGTCASAWTPMRFPIQRALRRCASRPPAQTTVSCVRVEDSLGRVWHTHLDVRDAIMQIDFPLAMIVLTHVELVRHLDVQKTLGDLQPSELLELLQGCSLPCCRRDIPRRRSPLRCRARPRVARAAMFVSSVPCDHLTETMSRAGYSHFLREKNGRNPSGNLILR